MSKPRIIFVGNFISGEPMPKGHREAVRKWAEHQALANAFRDDDMVFHHSSLWLVLIVLVFLMCMIGLYLS